VDPDDWVEAECTTHPRIRDRETHDAIREMRARRSTHGRRAGSRGVFTGVLRCGGCGGPMSVKSWPTKSGETFVYRCTRNVKQGKAACDAPVRARETTLMEAVVAELNAIRAGTVQPEVRLGDDRRPGLERQLAKVERRLDLAISNLDDPEMRERFTKQDLLERLDYSRSELERIQAEIDGLGSDPQQAGAALVKAFGIFAVLESERSDGYVSLESRGDGVIVDALRSRAGPTLVIEVGQEKLARWESEGGDLVIAEDTPSQVLTWEVDRDQWRAAVAQHVDSITATGPDTFAVVWC
jgi:hypothetical protein